MNIPEDVIRFHGHLCPGIAYGYRVSLIALREVGKRAKDEEIVAIVENDSCAVDAIQVMTGCTFGKGNFIFRDYGKQVYTFIRRPDKKAVRIAVKDISYRESEEEKQVWKAFMDGNHSEKVLRAIKEMKHKKVEFILSLDEDELLKIEHMELEPPPHARIYPSVICSRCGEKVMEPKTIKKDGLIFCIPCFESMNHSALKALPYRSARV